MLINAHWLKKNIKKSNLKILDCSWYLPNSKRNAKKEFINMRIPGAIFFDIDDICDKKSNFPHMLPSYKYFENKISDLGINTEDILVIYCKKIQLNNISFNYILIFLLNFKLIYFLSRNKCFFIPRTQI